MSKRPGHWASDLAAAHLGAISCTLYDTSSTDQIRYIARHSAAAVVVLEGAAQWARWRPIIDDLPGLRTVVVLDPSIIPPGDPRFVTYADLRGSGILVTSGGKNIAPTRVESLLRAHPLVGQAVAIGDRPPYVTALVVLDEEAAPAWAKTHGIDAVDPASLAAHSAVLREVDHAVAQANKALSRAEQVKAHRVLDVAWTAESGELTPKLSLRRRVIVERYAAEIDRLYTESQR
ncbi:hypothetical protein [Saccharopolyspora pogona]